MPIPHQEMRRIIKRRIIGLEGAERVRVLKACLAEFPGYYQGPYGELRKWVQSLIDQAQTRQAVRHQEAYFIPKEGVAQVVLVGPPNAGKSSLLRALTGRAVAVGDYPFTTLRPLAGMVKLEGAPVQLVDLPGLLEGAVDGRGGGKAVIGCVRMADAVLLIAPLTPQGLHDYDAVKREVLPQLDPAVPTAVVATKGDLEGAVDCWLSLSRSLEGRRAVRCSVQSQDGLDEVRHLIWEVCGLKRVYCKPRGKSVSTDPVVLPPRGTVSDLVSSLNRAWLEHFQQARVTGNSARFAGQAVGLDHPLADGDIVELVIR